MPTLDEEGRVIIDPGMGRVTEPPTPKPQHCWHTYYMQWLEIDKLYRSMSAWQLAERLRTAEVDHEKDKQAWMTENTELLTQVRSLTAELADMSHTDYLGRTRLDITNDSLAVRKLNGELRKQVKRLTEELKETNAKK